MAILVLNLTHGIIYLKFRSNKMEVEVFFLIVVQNIIKYGFTVIAQ